MKLLQEPDEHHLPDSPQALLPWYSKLLRRILSRIFSGTGITVAIGVGLVLALSVIIGADYLERSRNVDKDGISQADFYAANRMEIIDKEATQRKIDRAKQTIPPVYQPDEPHNQDITQALNKLLDHLGKMVTNPELSKEARYGQYQLLTEGKTNAENIYTQYFQTSIPENEWQNIAQASRIGMERILKAGFTEADEHLKRSAIIQYSIPEMGFKAKYRTLVYFLLDASLEPNLILDEMAMRRKQEEISAQINQQPELKIYSRKEKIIGKGERANPLQMTALQRMGKLSGGNNWGASLGVFLLSLLFVFTLWSYLYSFRNRQFFQPAYAAMISTLVLLTTVFFHLQEAGAFGNIPLFAFPLATVGLTLAIFTSPLLSVLTTTLLVFLLALTLRADFASLSVLLFGSYMGIYIVGQRTQYRDRGKLMYAGFYVGATNVLILLALSLLRPTYVEASGMPAASDVIGWSIFNLKMLGFSFFSGITSGILTIGWLPLLETIFRLITPYTLMELGNHDQPLLKRMQFEAPGTFHHSLMVASLSEAAAEAIDANALLTRVGCLYHDIGKMKRPLFFIENQAYFGVENPHDKLTPRLSKMVITAHPRDSIEMAKHHRLPEILMRFMTEHHGTLTAGYFYSKACQEEGAENVNKSQFRYPGPKPASKETAIVMLADACESAVRALKNPTVAAVEERIDKIIQQRIEDGQFDNCPITFQDIYKIKQTFVRVLRGIQHNRIEYQQNMMRELGRKLPQPATAEQASLQDALLKTQESPKPPTKAESPKAGEK
ncbi:HD family phosphohydrolase [Vampirovibrio sp.]|uniref:HD family phosphohydrolase n=1 Tax=Vampirovibrio sp. TaxID=2717857 RepID=UPI00359465F5